MNFAARALVTFSLLSTAVGCDQRDSDDAGCDDGRSVEAVVVSIEPAGEGDCDAPMQVLVDIVDPDTGEILEADHVLTEGWDAAPVAAGWLADEEIVVGTVLPAYEAAWCEGGGYDVLLDFDAASC